MTDYADAPSRAPMFVAIVAWLAAGFGRAVAAANASSGAGSEKAGAFVGTLLGALLVAFLVRCIVRLVRRRPILSPGWTPSLFFTAAGVSVLSIASVSGQS